MFNISLSNIKTKLYIFIAKYKAKNVRKLINNLSKLNTPSFIGIKNYTNQKNEVSNYTVIANFIYDNAISHDLKSLKQLKPKELKYISANNNIDLNLLNRAKNELITSIENNKQIHTKSNQSKAQTETYIKINNSVKMHIKTHKLYMYALIHNKVVIKKSTEPIKPINKKELTKAKEAIKTYCNFKTDKFRMFVINKKQLTGIKINGQEITFKN